MGVDAWKPKECNQTFRNVLSAQNRQLYTRDITTVTSVGLILLLMWNYGWQIP
jgi:hypothetical protein